MGFAIELDSTDIRTAPGRIACSVAQVHIADAVADLRGFAEMRWLCREKYATRTATVGSSVS